MSIDPLISVLMTAYNREKYIGEAIESVLVSSYINFELIIVDDGSTDNTVNIVKEYKSKDERIKLYVNPHNLGQFANRNKAATYAKGEFIKYLDSDDTITPEGLQRIIESMNLYPEAGFGSESTDNITRLVSPRESYINHFFMGSDLLYMGPSAVVFRRPFFEQMGGFEENAGILSDTTLMLQMAAVSPLVALPANFLFWRDHDDRVTIFQKDLYKMVLERHAINDKILGAANCPFNEEEKQMIRRNFKNIFIRRSLQHIHSLGSVRSYFDLAKKIGIGWKDYFFALQPNKALGQ